MNAFVTGGGFFKVGGGFIKILGGGEFIKILGGGLNCIFGCSGKLGTRVFRKTLLPFDVIMLLITQSNTTQKLLESVSKNEYPQHDELL